MLNPEAVKNQYSKLSKMQRRPGGIIDLILGVTERMWSLEAEVSSLEARCESLETEGCTNCYYEGYDEGHAAAIGEIMTVEYAQVVSKILGAVALNKNTVRVYENLTPATVAALLEAGNTVEPAEPKGYSISWEKR